MRGAATIAMGLAGALSGAALSAPNQPRSGSSGILGVPDADTTAAGASTLGAEVRLDRDANRHAQAGLSPVAAVFGLGWSEIGFILREGGMPGDPRSPVAGAALKVRLAGEDALPFGIALRATVDRANFTPQWGAQVVLSRRIGPMAFAGYGGALALALDADQIRPSAGAAASLELPLALALLASAQALPGGRKLEAALRWSPAPFLSLTAGFERLPQDQLSRFTVGIAVSQAPAPRPRLEAARGALLPSAAAADQGRAPQFPDERARFRLRLPQGSER